MFRSVFTRFAMAVVAAFAASAAQANERPLHIIGAGVADHSTGDFTAVGTGTHLGSWTNSGHIVVTGGPPVLDVNGYVTFVAANGDELWALIVDGTLDVSGDPWIGAARTVVIGGTGRFADATGEGGMHILEDPSGSFTFTVEGTIDY